MDKKEKTTAPVSSAPTDAELSSAQSTNESITDKHTEIKEKKDPRHLCILHCLTAGFAEQIGRVAPAVGRDAEQSGRLGFLPAEAGFHL